MWALAAWHVRSIKGASLSRAAWAVVPTFSLVCFVERQISFASCGFKAGAVTAKVTKSGEVVWGDWHVDAPREGLNIHRLLTDSTTRTQVAVLFVTSITQRPKTLLALGALRLIVAIDAIFHLLVIFKRAFKGHRLEGEFERQRIHRRISVLIRHSGQLKHRAGRSAHSSFDTSWLLMGCASATSTARSDIVVSNIAIPTAIQPWTLHTFSFECTKTICPLEMLDFFRSETYVCVALLTLYTSILRFE